jgi:hypothetical protein
MIPPVVARADERSSIAPIPSGPAAIRTSELGLLAAGALGVLTPNPMLTALAFVSLALILRLTARPGEPPILAAILAMQWLQATAPVFHADVLGLPLWKTADAHEIDQAAYLSTIWVVAVAVGCHIGAARTPTVTVPRADEVHAGVVGRLFVIYVIYYLATGLIALVPYGGMLQIARTVTALRMVFVFALLLFAVRRGAQAHYAWFAFVFELLNGFLGFFSTFKTPLFLLLIATLVDARRFSPLRIISVTILVGAIAFLGIVWTAVKMDYRKALNQGTGNQVVAIDRRERIETLEELTGNLNAEDLSKATEQLIQRVGYIQFFAHVLDYVPRVRDHEGGAQWLGAFQHVFYPRVLFPDKAPLESDTLITERYTGLALVHEAQQTSISIGIPGETYVDFGPLLMFVPALLIGLLYGFSFHVLVRLSRYPWIALGFAVAVLIEQQTIGHTPAKLLGGHLTCLGVAVVMWKMVGPRIERWVFRGAER